MFLFFLNELVADGMEIAFVIKLMAFVYMLFWLYYTFNRIPVLFGITSVILAYFMFIYSIPTLLLVLFLIGFVFLGSQLQMIVMFGLSPIARTFFGIDLTGQEEAMKAKHEYETNAIYAKVNQGQRLSEEEHAFLQQLERGQTGEEDAFQRQQQNLRRLGG